MKPRKIIQLSVCVASAVYAAVVSTASAQTNYIGVGTGSALDIDLSGNWDNGLPTSSGNVGTININSTVEAGAGFTYTGYYLNLTGGVMGQHGVGNDPLFDGGAFSVNGGTYGTTGGRAFRTSNSNVTTLNSGTINSGSNGAGTLITGSSLTVNGGTYLQSGTNRNIRLTGGSTITVNGGSLGQITTTATGIFGISNLSTGNNIVNLNGGTTSVNFLSFGNNNASSQLTLNIGGTSAGSFTAVDFLALSASELITERAIAWFEGSNMTFSVTGENDWAETEWAAGRMTYEGQNYLALGDWSTVNGTIFDWNGTTNTLSLIPEPSSTALFAAGLVALLGIRRRAPACI